MLFAYKYVGHRLEGLHTYLEHLVKVVWCRNSGAAYSLNLLYPPLKALVEAIYYDEAVKTDWLDGPIKRIDTICQEKLTAAKRSQLAQWFDHNNDIEALCEGIQVPATYEDLHALDPELNTELKKFCTDLFSSVINLSAVKETLSCFKEHYIAFSTINDKEKCPYCGFSDLAGEYNERREAYDHYLPKSKYPFNSVNFRNLAPMCNKCNSSYKLAKDPISNLEGTRRKAFYTFTQNHPDIDFNLKLNCDSLDVLKPDHITIQISCRSYEEQIETWKEVFGIDERYRIKCCGKNDGKAWLARITDECQNYDRSPSEMLESELQTARNQKMADANFLKAPFLEACNRAGLIKDRPQSDEC